MKNTKYRIVTSEDAQRFLVEEKLRWLPIWALVAIVHSIEEAEEWIKNKEQRASVAGRVVKEIKIK